MIAIEPITIMMILIISSWLTNKKIVNIEEDAFEPHCVVKVALDTNYSAPRNIVIILANKRECNIAQAKIKRNLCIVFV